MNVLNKLLLCSACKGIAVGWVLLAILLFANVGNMGDVILRSSSAPLAIFLLMVGFGITFGSTAIGRAIMSIPVKKPPTAAE